MQPPLQRPGEAAVVRALPIPVEAVGEERPSQHHRGADFGTDASDIVEWDSHDEVVEKGVIEHAIRFTVSSSQHAYIAPASHYASSDTSADAPPMGLRFRMKADYDCSAYSSEAQVVCTAMKKYGMIVADNGSDWYFTGAPNPLWNDEALDDLKLITGDAFEAVYTGDPVTN